MSLDLHSYRVGRMPLDKPHFTRNNYLPDMPPAQPAATPRVPLAPIMSFRGLYPRNARGCSAFNRGRRVALTSGRVAIATAVKHAHFPEASQILLPALHCTAMVAPVRWAGMDVVFYPLRSDLSIDFDHLEKLLSSRTRGLLITHFFGFPQDVRGAREFCDSHDLILIEDCAHAHYGLHGGICLGELGDYAISSSVKFFPVFDGGYLYSSTHDLSTIALQRSPLRFQLKSAVNMLDRAVGYNRLGAVGKLLSGVLRPLRSLPRAAADSSAGNGSAPIAPASAEGGYDFEPFWYGKKMSVASRVVASMADENRLVHRRRANYAKLLAAVASLHNCRPLFPNLHEGIVPLIFPLYVETAASSFSQLKELGVPMWRFGEYLDPEVQKNSICAVSLDYGEHVLQLPCHQELRESELEWIIQCLKKVLG